MPQKLSFLLNTTSKALNQLGVFDGFTDLDSRLHVDPGLLLIETNDEFEGSYSDFQDHFKKVLLLIRNSKTKGDLMWRNALGMLQFKEIGNTALGYSHSGTGGSAIGPNLAENILETAIQLVEAGINDPVIFELVGLFEKGIGADRISDMTISILFPRFARYSKRIAMDLNMPTSQFEIQKTIYELPFDPQTGEFIVLCPKKYLRDLPIATDVTDIERVVKYNHSVRASLNQGIGSKWKKIAREAKRSKAKFKELILNHPKILVEVIKTYKSAPRIGYDFENDPLGELIWADLAEKAVKDLPLPLGHYNPISSDNILDVVTEICNRLKFLIENNGWFEFLYKPDGNLKPERAPQFLFYGIAEAYCEANNLDLSREPNAGIGSLDFKVSRGVNAKVTVEVKYSANPKLISGFEKQLPAYNAAEKSNTSIYLVIETSKGRNAIQRLNKIATAARNKVNRVPIIIKIDGRRQKSASNR